jgi:methionyl-tRNA formyltransferase
MTDVPFGRGGSPLQNLIVRGFAETKISAIRCVAEIDAGPVYMKRPLSLLGSAEEIFVRAADVIEEMILEMVSNEPEPVPQQGEPVYFERRRPEQGALDLFPTLTQAFDAIRMLDAPGYPPAFADVGPFRLELTKAHRDEDFIEAKVRILMRKPRESES